MMSAKAIVTLTGFSFFQKVLKNLIYKHKIIDPGKSIIASCILSSMQATPRIIFTIAYIQYNLIYAA